MSRSDSRFDKEARRRGEAEADKMDADDKSRRETVVAKVVPANKVDEYTAADTERRKVILRGVGYSIESGLNDLASRNFEQLPADLKDKIRA